ncbi:serine hydrolase [Flavobacterium selenitireducens]|uniref:serine hydrolase n=1 Tax=Flavobacterium selenitireducens TaxID=2722704 RepID=UPI00168A4C26|nr:serine hydrolase [Flavobacterium selenitireducens]MBD3583570.1 serine hydrolase [Flavobacterium selenitireducens]
MKKIILSFLMALPLWGTAQNVAGEADAFVSDLVSKNLFSGNVLIARDGELLFQKSYGFADLENKRLNATDTEFRAGSLTKMFTATLILQYVDKEKISLWDTLDKFVPHLANAKNITIRNLLSHSSGIKGSIPQGAKNLEEIVQGFESEPSAFKPGTRFEYNNFNYMLLGYIAEKIGGRPYAELVSRNIFRKLGMAESGIDHNGRVSQKSALGYMVDPGTGSLARMESGNVDVASSAGALYTTTGDLLKWSRAIENGKLLSEKSWKMALAEVRPGYGLGWMVRRDGDRTKFGHTGSIEGFMSDFQYFPESGVTVIFLSNVLPPRNTQISSALSAIAFNQPFELDKPKEEIALSAETLRKYVGTYELEGQKMVVSQKEGKLLVLAPMGDTAELGAVGPNKFFVKGPQIGVEFLEEDGKVTAMNLDMRGGQRFVKLQ